MKQIVQNPRSGSLELLEVPTPTPARGQLLVRNHFSVVSPGTEKMAMDFARKSLLGKARSRPDLVKQVVRKLRQEGPAPTYRAVMNRLETPQPLGYSCAGVVEAVGEGVSGFAPGDRVACAGAGYANHAEWICVPENLAVQVPGGVPLEKAAFATLGAIALQGIRVASPTLGEIGLVIGLGLIGQLAVQLLRANGCRVLGIDVDPERVKQALDQGAEWADRPEADQTAWLEATTGGHGADFALVTAASESPAPIRLAADLCRAKGRVAVVGATAMNLDRRSFYEKELELRMSMSYGPGRYDRRYEELGLDYPLAYVRWTENRNLQAFLQLTASAAIDPARLDVQTLPFEQAERTYGELARGERRSLAVVFRYDPAATAERQLEIAAAPRKAKGEIGVAFIGAGNYARAVLLPAVDRAKGIRKLHVVTATGASARRTAEKFGYATCGTDPQIAFDDPSVDLVFVATQDDTHASFAEAALRAGKAVWLEKPAAIDEEQLERLAGAVRETDAFLAVGFNRRFSPHVRAIRAAFADRRGPMAIRYTVAAGPPAAGGWQLEPGVGGGRIVGEACHFVDLCSHLAGAPPATVFARALGRDPQIDDSTLLVLGLADGSTAAIEYLANTGPALAKERWEVSADRRTASCDNFRTSVLPDGKHVRTLNQDKGQATAIAEVIEAVRAGSPSPFALDTLVAVTLATLRAGEAASRGVSVALDAPPGQPERKDS